MKKQRNFEEVSVRSLPNEVFLNASTSGPWGANALRTALVVDDNHKTADTLVRVLQAHGFLAEAAYNGAQGLVRAKELRPGLVISDVGMPRMDGITMVDSISRILPHTKIILLCECLPENANLLPWHVLKKPFQPWELLAVLGLHEAPELQQVRQR